MRTRSLSVHFHYDLDQTKRWLNTYFGRFLFPSLAAILLLCLLSAFVCILGRLRAITVADHASPQLVFSFCSAIVAFVAGQILAGLADMVVMLLVFVPLAIVAWFVVRMALNLIYPLFYPVDSNPTKWAKRYDRFFSHKLLGASFACNSGFILVVLVGFLLAIKEQGMSPVLMIHCLGVSFCLAVFYAFGFHWFIFLRILKRKDTAKRTLPRFNAYLFSDESIKSSFLGSLKFMVFIAVLAWFLIPVPARLSAKIAKGTEWYVSLLVPDYAAVRSEAQKNIFLKSGINWEKMLPSAENLGNEFDLWSGLREVICPKQGSPLFLRYLFLLVALASLFQVALPVATRISREYGYAPAARKLLMAALKTTTVVFLLKLFVAKAFLVDFSSVIGMGTAFTYLLAAFIAFQDTGEKKML